MCKPVFFALDWFYVHTGIQLRPVLQEPERNRHLPQGSGQRSGYVQV